MVYKLTDEDIQNAVILEEVYKLGNKTTAVVLTLRNGFEVVGTSACVDPSDFNIEIGTTIARKHAVDKVWELEGYALQAKHPIADSVKHTQMEFDFKEEEASSEK